MSSYNSYQGVGSALNGVFAGIFIVLVILVLIALAIAVLQIIGYWKILSKGGKPGWGALIPIYN